MGAIGDIVMRASSPMRRKEDRSVIYHQPHDPEVIDSGEHRGVKYEIITDGNDPSVKMFFYLVCCVGCDAIIIEVGEKRLRLERKREGGIFESVMSHVFDDKEYNVDELHGLANSMIDSLLQEENKFLKCIF